MKYCNTFLILFFIHAGMQAQLHAVQELDEVVLTDTRLSEYSKGYKVEKIPDSIRKEKSISLTETLRFYSAIYFKENGFGMVSSPSFRGTNASQTAVIWNGININSIFTGQTDFNTISPVNFSDIAVRSGGGGVLYGSGAVGGSVHLDNSFDFNKKNETRLGVRYGSFQTLGGNFETVQTWENHYLNIGIDFISSENDYRYIGKNKKNKHGEFLRFSAKINEARKWKKGIISWNSEYSYNDRNFSSSLNTLDKDAYIDIHTRNLFRITQKSGIFKTTGHFAHLYEQFRYYPDSEKPYYSDGHAHSLIGGIQSEISVKNRFRILGKLEQTHISADGENIGNRNRNNLAAVLQTNHKVSRFFTYGIHFRKEFFNSYSNPFLFAGDARWQISEAAALRVNGSKNYRIPTFNDLYWHAGGNEELKPETSYQLELGQELNLKNFYFDLALFYISSKDMIKWIPGRGSMWIPVNISENKNYGAEAIIKYKTELTENQKISADFQYSFTRAEDLENKKQLIYVPYHKAAGKVSYSYNNSTAYLQGNYTGSVFTTTDNSSKVAASTVFNLGISSSLTSDSKITAGVAIDNLFNIYYENVAFRPMPSRSYQIFLTFKI